MHRFFRAVPTARVTTARYSTHPIRESRLMLLFSKTDYEKET